MTEAEWLACTNPPQLLDVLCDLASDRRMRLCLCAFCRCVWPLLQSRSSRRAIEQAEAFADDLIDADQLEKAHVEAWETWTSWPRIDVLTVRASRAAAFASKPLPRDDEVMQVLDDSLSAEAHLDAAQAQADRALRLRDIFGNPFRPVTIELDWLTWQNRTISALAQAAYDDRDLPAGHLRADKLAILADALEEAGCTSEEILGHLRGPGPHVRGCWVLDLLLGKE